VDPSPTPPTQGLRQVRFLPNSVYCVSFILSPTMIITDINISTVAVSSSLSTWDQVNSPSMRRRRCTEHPERTRSNHQFCNPRSSYDMRQERRTAPHQDIGRLGENLRRRHHHHICIISLVVPAPESLLWRSNGKSVLWKC
jgi:hypothetical protein